MNNKILKMGIISCIVMSSLGVAMPITCAAEPEEKLSTSEVVVTANRTQEEIKAIPQATEVITAQDIQDLGATTVQEALALAHDVTVRSGTVGSNVQIRGMSKNHILILVDGKRMAGEDTAKLTNSYALERLNVNDIERIEIVRGSSSALYGSDAIGGIINIITKVPSEFSTTIGTITGTKNTATYVYADLGKNGRWSSSVSARWDKVRERKEYQYSEQMGRGGKITVIDGINSNMYGMHRTYHTAAKYDFENANKNTLRFDVDYLKDDLKSAYADAYSKSPAGKTVTAKNKYSTFDNERIGFSVEYAGQTDRNDYSFRTYYDQLKKNTNTYNARPDFRGPPAIVNMLNKTYPKMTSDFSKYTTWVAEAKDTMYVNDAHTLTFGGEYRFTEYEGTRLKKTAGSTVGKHNFNSYAGYAEDLWQVNDDLLITPSLRFEHNSHFGNKTTPKLGLTYHINDKLRFKSNYGKGYKAPTVSEMYLDMTHPMGPAVVMNIVGNPNLKPEESTNFDVGFEYDDGKTFGKISYFKNKVNNLIATKRIESTKTTYVNIDKTQVNGVETEIGHHLSNRLSVKIHDSWLDATDSISGERLTGRAKNAISFQLVYDDHKNDGFSAVLWDTFISDFYDTDRNGKDRNFTYNTLNFSFNKKFKNGMSVFGGIDNILNKKDSDIYLDGRVWRVGVERKF